LLSGKKKKCFSTNGGLLLISHDTTKNKIDAPKEEQTPWLLNVFLSHEIFLKFAFLMERRVLRWRDAEMIFIPI